MPGSRCVVAQALAVCVLPEEANCRMVQCPASLVCDSNGLCRSRCATEDDCLGEQLCVPLTTGGNGVCVERAVYDAGGTDAAGD
jgi:hypothetical protein